MIGAVISLRAQSQRRSTTPTRLSSSWHEPTTSIIHVIAIHAQCAAWRTLIERFDRIEDERSRNTSLPVAT
jgi:hypothetical protein